MSPILHILHSQLFVSLPYPNFDFSNQTCIVTGSNSGIGLEAAKHLVRLNAARVILAVRNVTRGEEAKEWIETETGRKDVVEVWHLDLSSYESVKQFAHHASNNLDRLDCLLENAGTGSFTYQTAEDNESTITINVVSTFLLAILMLPLLRKTAKIFNTQPRLSFVVSDVHAMANFPERNNPNIFASLNADRSSAALRRRYAVSKLLEVLLTRELASRVSQFCSDNGSQHDIIVNCVNPGFCKTNLGDKGPWIGRILRSILAMFLARTAEEGSRTLVFAAAASTDTHGKYLSDCRIEK